MTHNGERHLARGPVWPHERPQLLTDRCDLLDALALPDTASNVRPTIEGLACLKKVQAPSGTSSPSCSTVCGKWYKQPNIGPCLLNLRICGSAPVSALNDCDAGAIQLASDHAGNRHYEACAEANPMDKGC